MPGRPVRSEVLIPWPRSVALHYASRSVHVGALFPGERLVHRQPVQQRLLDFTAISFTRTKPDQQVQLLGDCCHATHAYATALRNVRTKQQMTYL